VKIASPAAPATSSFSTKQNSVLTFS